MTVSTSPVLSSAPSPSSSSSSSPEVITSITCMSVSVPRSWARLSSPPPASGSTSSAGPEASWSPRRRKLPPCFWALGWGIWGEDDYQMIIRKLRRQWSPPGPQLSLPRWLHEPEFIYLNMLTNWLSEKRKSTFSGPLSKVEFETMPQFVSSISWYKSEYSTSFLLDIYFGIVFTR